MRTSSTTDARASFSKLVESASRTHDLHETRKDTPDGIVIDASAPLTEVVDEILRRSGATP